MTFPVPGGATFLRASADYFSNQQLASGETCLPRIAFSSGAALVSGTVSLTYWTAAKTEVCNQLSAVSGGVAAGATPTYAAMGIYLVDSAGNLALLAQCASDTTLFSVTFSTNTRALTSQLGKVAGQRYAFGLLVVSAAGMPTPVGPNGTLQLASIPPRLAGQLAGQAALPASIPAGSVANSASGYLAAVTPL